MAHDPSCYTVMDTRSLASLRALGRLHPGPVGATKDEWGLVPRRVPRGFPCDRGEPPGDPIRPPNTGLAVTSDCPRKA